MINEPDFEKKVKKDFPLLSKMDQFRIANYLSQAYEKGFEDGDKNGWWKAQEQPSINDVYLKEWEAETRSINIHKEEY
jgi:hypothetical protein